MKFHRRTVATAQRLTEQTNTIDLLAPLSGRLISLSELSHPLLAHQLLGSGIAIQYNSFQLLAPTDGKLPQISAVGDELLFETSRKLKIMFKLITATGHSQAMDSANVNWQQQCDQFIPLNSQQNHTYSQRANSISANWVRAGEPLAVIKQHPAQHSEQQPKQQRYCALLVTNLAKPVKLNYNQHPVFAGQDRLLQISSIEQNRNKQ